MDRQRAVWETPECPFRIEYSVAVLNQIRMAAVEAFYSVPHGGVEIGGVLFGNIEPGRVVIRSFRRMECEHALGPSFSLSEHDLEGLERLLKQSQADPALAGQERVGWFHSHTRSEVCLTENDLDIYHGFFPGPMEVALVLRPLHLKPTRAGFFFRDQAGEIRADAPAKEFVAEQAYLQAFTADEPTAKPLAQAEPVLALPPPAARERVAGPEPVPAPTLSHLGKWVAAAIVAATLSSAAIILLWRPNPAASSAAVPAAGVDFEAAEVEGDTVLRWNRQAPVVQHAAGGVLDIRDGDQQKQLALQPGEVRRGLAVYRRTSSRAEFHLRLWQEGQPPQEESQTIEGPVPPVAPATRPKGIGTLRRR